MQTTYIMQTSSCMLEAPKHLEFLETPPTPPPQQPTNQFFTKWKQVTRWHLVGARASSVESTALLHGKNLEGAKWPNYGHPKHQELRSLWPPYHHHLQIQNFCFKFANTAKKHHGKWWPQQIRGVVQVQDSQIVWRMGCEKGQETMFFIHSFRNVPLFNSARIQLLLSTYKSVHGRFCFLGRSTQSKVGHPTSEYTVTNPTNRVDRKYINIITLFTINHVHYMFITIYQHTITY